MTSLRVSRVATESPVRRGSAITALCLTVLALLAGSLVVPHLLTQLAGSTRLSVSIWGAILGDGFEVIAIGIVVARVERRPLRSLGLRRPRVSHLVAAFGIAVALTVVNALGAGLGHAGSGGLHRIGTLSVAQRAVLVVTVAVAEEVVYRGMLVSRLAEVTGSSPIAIVASSLLFAAGHVQFFGVAYFAVVAVPALTLGVLFTVTDDLAACILVHLLLDLPILLL